MWRLWFCCEFIVTMHKIDRMSTQNGSCYVKGLGNIHSVSNVHSNRKLTLQSNTNHRSQDITSKFASNKCLFKSKLDFRTKSIHWRETNYWKQHVYSLLWCKCQNPNVTFGTSNKPIHRRWNTHEVVGYCLYWNCITRYSHNSDSIQTHIDVPWSNDDSLNDTHNTHSIELVEEIFWHAPCINN